MSDPDYKAMFRASCHEWAEDHNFLQELCKQAGYDDDTINGDYMVPGIQDLAQLLFDRIAK